MPVWHSHMWWLKHYPNGLYLSRVFRTSSQTENLSWKNSGWTVRSLKLSNSRPWSELRWVTIWLCILSFFFSSALISWFSVLVMVSKKIHCLWYFRCLCVEFMHFYINGCKMFYTKAHKYAYTNPFGVLTITYSCGNVAHFI